MTTVTTVITKSERPPASDDGPKRREATAVLYADIRGFTATLDRIESEPDGTDKMKGYLAAWQLLRDALVRDEAGATKGFYLANRVGDAFVLLVFEKDPRRWHEYVTGYLGQRFAAFADEVRKIDPASDPHLKVSLYSTPTKRVTYYETGVMNEALVRGFSIARRDFLCTAINKCARMDALEQADTSVLLCNEGAFQWLSSEGALDPSRFDDLGMRELRGFRERERVFALSRR
jgi:class 3 adenylate cyclase